MTMTEERLDAAFAALADPTRRAIVSRLAQGDATVGELAAPFDMSLPGISKHLKVLERSGLISRGATHSSGPATSRSRRSTVRWTGSARTGACGTSASTSSMRCWPASSGNPRRARRQRERRAPVPEHGGAPNELRFSRVFDAPRELVFRCMTDPDHLTHFWGPKGVSAPRDGIKVDARPGGAFETVMVNDLDGNEYATRAVYDEVRPPERLSWTEAHSGMRVTTEFVALGPDRTEVRIHRGTCPRPSCSPRSRPGSCPRSTASTRISHGWSHRSLP